MKHEQAVLDPAPIRENSANLSDRIALGLGTEIISGSVPAGSRLPTESELCDLYGVSRSVIRDAIRTLVGRGLVEVYRGGRGMLISQVTDAPFAQALIILLMRSDLTIADVREARAALETELSLLSAARGEESDWDAMDQHLTAYGDAVAAADWGAARDAHLAFHSTMLKAIRMPALTIILKPMQQIILLCSLPPQVSGRELALVWTPEDVETHRPILTALRAADPQRAHAAMEAHFDPSFNRGRDRFKSYWSRPFRESSMSRVLLKEFLSAQPEHDRGSSEA
jgi:GntR family transcriptional repressor for pyruvate dehydrogenase complex